MTRRPTPDEPVNDTMSTSGCAMSASPATRPAPVTTLSTPSGSPASVAASAKMQGGERRHLGRLEHDRVAGGDRREDLPAGHLQRVVPRRDGPDHPDRLPADQRGVVAGVLPGRLALEVAGGAGEERDVVDRCRGRRSRWRAGSACRSAGTRCWASSSARASSIAASRVSAADRSTGAARDHSGNAARAAATAASTSAGAGQPDGLHRLAGRRVDDVERRWASPASASCDARRRTGARESTPPVRPTRRVVRGSDDPGRAKHHGQAIPSR